MRKPLKQLKLVINAGRITAIYDDALTALFPFADVETKRASHVEPDCWPKSYGCRSWAADLTPVGGPILRGFKTRQAALDAEVRYLRNYVVV